ncbi:hypothetical protein BATDEDRAFT_36431 [Batrachochytrium dendrobatidis JAM81]|uniref:Grx4 family monothiol glutaredoxin n=2 Tax=Batrachochytrium dendrobatidis TaxID=109871 RepID=F4NV01_BATDJ|nr:uncharacterized protein BATDEDRAFT_36431 [Batrachochytrium dendrobatidis JAM81]EGF84062.1 hypothetical protein BATDEDRAFT_36431 [Batrachochytrium dendrobatidis JAM81]KAJ8325613.1 glutaredoxin [Batrachochytrium dendrobatidis]KAK5671410.1 glutaredoxin [Batrachochytrium dendrobatidis]OAJ36518.1 Grx4 family monothiol glutaredoxin [Batrachochytrium dendrobatidis JEL423]|eukprot:XP_006675865.1 hypothetical protein BATDEDRAFT_36431 [Batrachochytrium dendrobatidis JAM81]
MTTETATMDTFSIAGTTSAAKQNVNDVTSDDHFASLVASCPVSVINCWAEWHEPSRDMNLVFEELSRKYPVLSYIRFEAETFPDISEKYEIATVPTFMILRDNGTVVERIEGANAPLLTSTVDKYCKYATTLLASATPSLNAVSADSDADSNASMEKKLKVLVSSHPIMLFMKGTPSQPRCGFSRQTVELMAQVGCEYGSFDILADDAVRQALKKYSNWPTYPQIYVNGELIGGLDILKELIEQGEFQNMVPKEDDLNTRLGKLVKRANVMLFMKGSPSTPRCGFSRQVVKLLDEQSVVYETFDILEDEQVRTGLKEYSNWPTFPQLYIKGELVGGLDILKEMIEQGEFQAMIA